MSIKIASLTLVLGIFLSSPLPVFADDVHPWILWEEVLNWNAILYPNNQNPSVRLPFGEAMAYSVFPSDESCERKRSELADQKPSLAKGLPYYFICLPKGVRPFYFGG